MKKYYLIVFALLAFFTARPQGSCNLLNIDCSSFPGPHASGLTRSSGTTYTCTTGNYVWYTSSTGNAYIATDNIDVPQENGISISIKSKKYSSANPKVEVYIRVTGYYSFNNVNPTYNGWVKVGDVTNFSCGYSTINVPSQITGGQRVAVCILIKGAFSSSWYALDEICISSVAGSSAPTTYE